MLFRIFVTISALAAFSQTAFAQSMVIGDGGAKQCYHSVKYGDPGRASTIRDCKKALTHIDLTFKDKAATHVNLGILYMRSGEHVLARQHYDIAIKMTPNLPEAYINNSAALIYMGEYRAAIKAINTAISLGTTKMPEALYNRAMAYDNLKQYDKAYKDLKRALALRPEWKPALLALDNYEIATTPVN